MAASEENPDGCFRMVVPEWRFSKTDAKTTF